MRSTTVGWLTSIVSVLPVIADHMWLNTDCPELRDSISHPIAPTNITPRNSPSKRANKTVARDRTGLEVGGRSGSLGILARLSSIPWNSDDQPRNCCAKIKLGTSNARKDKS